MENTHTDVRVLRMKQYFVIFVVAFTWNKKKKK